MGVFQVACHSDVSIYSESESISPSVLSDPIWTVARQATVPMGFSQWVEWVAIYFFRGSSKPRDRTWVSCIAGTFFTI